MERAIVYKPKKKINVTDTSENITGSAYRTIMTSSGRRMVRALSVREKHQLLSAVLRSITAIEHLKSEVSYVLSVTEDYDTIKTIPSGCDVLLTTLNDILATSLPVIRNDEERKRNDEDN